VAGSRARDRAAGGEGGRGKVEDGRLREVVAGAVIKAVAAVALLAAVAEAEANANIVAVEVAVGKATGQYQRQ